MTTIEEIETAPITVASEANEIESTIFHHADHIGVAFDLLQKYDVIVAPTIYANHIRLMAAKAGAPEKLNLTITCALMSLIAERLAMEPDANFDASVSSSPNRMSKDVLMRWHDQERLGAETAQSIFLLPKAA